ncbi:hypothetical protein KOAAANKH_03073 [Brevundimonas sp. NIBR10]|uniref:class I SAM-dependent methyltransferase n=1 Tax=Brevundimonas sp. NIBR10 TaxID=3015997 RepID=UPI0022F14B67|nr:class I SAM-dependent methyltransferase [Brevundimonas sp. NIBR10]WGM48177.1 hypothetical protein KOAAANKH_03073 [Brevundimonas sp. NIBR10]
MAGIIGTLRRRWHKVTGEAQRRKQAVAAMRTDDAIIQLEQRIDLLERTAALLSTEINASTAETRLLHRANRPLARRDVIERPPLVHGGPGNQIFDVSTMCRESDFHTAWFTHWSLQTGFWPRYHRKLWEYVFICQCLYERGLIAPHMRGVGFGVGEEVLPALFAAHGCEIVATDLGPEGAVGTGWIETAQHAHDRDSLRRPDICPEDIFDRNVSFQACDMNAIDPGLKGFDFCWSSCAFEHLGSIEHGLRFVENSIDCLRPGGWAVHTTEFNLFSNDETIDNQGTVLFRRRDFEELQRRLTLKGHRMAPLRLDLGEGVIENVIDVPPFSTDVSLRIAISGFATTSFGLLIQRAPTSPEPLTKPEVADDHQQILTYLMSQNVDERRHGVVVAADRLKRIDAMTPVQAQLFHQALLDAILAERDHDMLASEAKGLAESVWPLTGLAPLDQLAEFAPFLPYDAAVFVLLVLERRGDPGDADRLESGLGARTIYPTDEAKRLIAQLRAKQTSISDL